MFSKKTSQKTNHRRPSCGFFFCIFTDHSPAANDSGHSKSPPSTASGGTKPRAACFSWYWIRRKKRSPEPPVAIAISVPAYKGRIADGAEEKNIKHRRSKQQKPASGSGEVIMELQQPLLPPLTHKYDTRNRTEPPVNTEVPAPNRRKHGQTEPHRPAATVFLAKSPARATPRGEKLGPQAGLTVLGMTIAFTVLCGRAAAVVSLCACLYLAAFLRQPELAEKAAEKMAAAGGGDDVGSKERKKRVVMEGFLERGRRKPLGTVSALER